MINDSLVQEAKGNQNGAMQSSAEDREVDEEEEDEEEVVSDEDEEDGSGVKLGDLVRMVKDAEQSECTYWMLHDARCACRGQKICR